MQTQAMPAKPSKRSQAVSGTISSIFINSYDILRLSGQKLAGVPYAFVLFDDPDEESDASKADVGLGK
jgi:hypothetical protein